METAGSFKSLVTPSLLNNSFKKKESFRASSSKTLLGVALQVSLQLGFCGRFFSSQLALGWYFPPSPPALARL